MTKYGSPFCHGKDVIQVGPEDKSRQHHPFLILGAGHLLWDMWLPIVTLLDLFEFDNDALFLTFIRVFRRCREDVNKFRSLLGIQDEIPDINKLMPGPKSILLCAKHSVSGMGWLTDHGLSAHGKTRYDFENPVNVRRGPQLVRFRSYIMEKMKIESALRPEDPPHILFNELSSDAPKRRISFDSDVREIRRSLKEDFPNVVVSSHSFSNYTLTKQIEVTSKAAVFVSACGSGTFPAFFLPKGATLIIYGDDEMMLDWDLWNNYGHIGVYWLSLSKRKRETDLLLHAILDALHNLY